MDGRGGPGVTLDLNTNSKSGWKTVLSTFGVLNLAFSFVGLYLVGQSLTSSYRLSNSQRAAYVVEVFYAMSLLNCLLLLALGAGGYLLLRRGIKAVAFCKLVFGAELVYVAAL